MGLFGGSRSSSSSTSTTTSNVLDYTDADNVRTNIQTVGDVGSNSRVTTTDFGAVESGINAAMAALDYNSFTSNNALVANTDIAMSAIDASNFNLVQSLDAVNENVALAQATTNDAVRLAGETSRSEAATAITQLMRYAVIAGLGVIALLTAAKIWGKK